MANNSNFNLDFMNESLDADDTPDSTIAEGTDVNVPVPSKTEIDAETYMEVLSALKKSFKEATEIIDGLTGGNAQPTLEQRQNEYLESCLDAAYLEAFENGPIYEAVSRDDKDDVRRIVTTIRPKLKKVLNGQNGSLKFYDTKIVARIIVNAAVTIGGKLVAANMSALSTGLLFDDKTPIGVSNAVGAVGKCIDSNSNSTDAIDMIWKNRLWQIVGMVYVESGNIKDVCDELNKHFADELGNYKVLYAKALPNIVDLFRMKFNWKNNKVAYFLLIDKNVPQDVKEILKQLDNVTKDAKTKDGGKAIKESMYSCDESDFDDVSL